MAGGVATLEIAPGDADQRLDRWFRRHYPGIGHGRLEKLLRTGQIRVNGKRARAGTRLAPGDRVRVPPLPDPGEDRARRRPAPLDDADADMVQAAVIYRDDDVIALNKPPGLAVQGGSRVRRHLDGMLDALRFEAAEAPRLVHRLDRDTSGVILLARHAHAARELTALFRTRDLQKLYWALVVGVPKPAQGRIDAPLAKRQAGAGERAGERMVATAEGGARAVTDYALVESAGRQLSWLALMPRTGRTHQLRAHTVSAFGFPIVGDGKYGGEAAFPPGFEPRLHLHARALELPRGRKAPLVLTAPLPPHMAASWRFLGFDPKPGGDEFALFEDAP